MPGRGSDLGQDDLGPDPGGVHLVQRAEELLRRITGCLSLGHLGRVGRGRRRRAAPARRRPGPRVPGWPPLLALASSALWGSSDFLGGLLTRSRSAYAVVAGSQAFGLVTIAVVALVTGDWHASLGYLPWAVGAGLSGGVGLVAYYAALSSGTMGVVAPIASMGAVVPVVLGRRRRGAAVLAPGARHRCWRWSAWPRPAGRSCPAGRGRRPVLLAALAGASFGVALYFIGRGAEHNAVMTLVGMRASTVSLFLRRGPGAAHDGGVRPRGPRAAGGRGRSVTSSPTCSSPSPPSAGC